MKHEQKIGVDFLMHLRIHIPDEKQNVILKNKKLYFLEIFRLFFLYINKYMYNCLMLC